MSVWHVFLKCFSEYPKILYIEMGYETSLQLTMVNLAYVCSVSWLWSSGTVLDSSGLPNSLLSRGTWDLSWF